MRVGVLASGSGTILQAMLDRHLPVTVLIADRPCGALGIAENAGIGAELVHTNMEVLLEGGLAARSLGLPHVMHYRGNTLDRPRLVFDAR